MEIYKLSDEIEEKGKTRRGKQGVHSVASSFKVTTMKQGVKNPNRVNVFINGAFEFSLDLAQVVDYKLKIGKELSESEIAELKNASEFGKLYQRTLEWVLVKPRSVKEIRDYLSRKLRVSSSDTLAPARRYGGRFARSLPVGRQWSSEDTSELSKKIIERLTTHNYIDDMKFAEWYVENRFMKKGVSKKRLKMELQKKGISSEIIDEVLDKRNDEEEIMKMIVKKRAKYDDEKLLMYLCRQGFSYSEAKEAMEKYSSGDSN